MGSLAKWGAMAGVGKGMQENAATKKEDRQMQEKLDAQESRDMRIRKWQEERGKEKEVRTHDRNLDVTLYQHDLTELAKEGDKKYKSGESSLDRASAERIARINASGRSGTMQEWEKQRLKGGTMSVADGMGGETETATMTDQFSGITYAMVDGIWQAPPRMEGFGNNANRITSIKIQPKDSSEEWLGELRADRSEAMVEEFFDAHGWLPSWAFHGKAAYRK
jgi:hypothetical protein